MHISPTLAVLAALLLSPLSFAFAEDGPTADEALKLLLEGNKRFISGQATHPHQGVEYRASLAAGQHPIVAILSCADSRVAPELLFDQGLGDVFTCRVAGNILDDTVLGSLEYAVEHLHTPLIIVLGHEKCGAVKAAVDGGHAEGKIEKLVEKIAPSVAEAKQQSGDLLSNSVRTNVQYVVRILSEAGPIISEHVQAGKIKVVGARYNLATGVVELVPPAVVPAPTGKAKLTQSGK